MKSFLLSFFLFLLILPFNASANSFSDIMFKRLENTDTSSLVALAMNAETEGAELDISTIDFEFNAVKREGEVFFFWTHLTYGDPSYYIIQISEEGKEYENILSQESKGSGIGDIFFDSYKMSFEHKRYFRIKIIHKGGAYSFSPVLYL